MRSAPRRRAAVSVTRGWKVRGRTAGQSSQRFWHWMKLCSYRDLSARPRLSWPLRRATPPSTAAPSLSRSSPLNSPGTTTNPSRPKASTSSLSVRAASVAIGGNLGRVRMRGPWREGGSGQRPALRRARPWAGRSSRRHGQAELVALGWCRGRLGGVVGGASRGQEVLAQRVLLALVGADPLAVEHGGLLHHALEGELADALAVLDHEGHVVGAHLQRSPGASEPVLGVEAEAGIEEAGVVRA